MLLLSLKTTFFYPVLMHLFSISSLTFLFYFKITSDCKFVVFSRPFLSCSRWQQGLRWSPTEDLPDQRPSPWLVWASFTPLSNELFKDIMTHVEVGGDDVPQPPVFLYYNYYYHYYYYCYHYYYWANTQ